MLVGSTLPTRLSSRGSPFDAVKTAPANPMVGNCFTADDAETTRDADAGLCLCVSFCVLCVLCGSKPGESISMAESTANPAI